MLTALRNLLARNAPPSLEVIEYGKNPACQEMIAKTNAIVFDALSTEIKPHPVLIEEYREFMAAGLNWQTRHCHWKIQCEAAKSLGLDVLTVDDAAALLVGRKCERAAYKHWRRMGTLFLPRHNYDLADLQSDATAFMDFISTWADERHRIASDALPAYCAGRERIMFGDMEHLRVPISRGGVLRLGCVRKFTVTGLRIFDDGKISAREYDLRRSASLFNTFTILAPEECWLAPTTKDPILFGVICGPINRAEKCFMDRLVPLARWE